MLTYDLNLRDDLSLYEYLYRCIKKDILEGILRPGEKLPSKRSLARQFDISVITVENSYEQLIAEGYIYALEKRGYYVSEIHIDTAKKSQSNSNAPTPAATNPDVHPSKFAQTILYDLQSNNIDYHNFPFQLWSRLMRKVLSDKSNENELLRGGPSTGVTRLRTAIARYLHEFRGMQVSEEQIVIGAGTEYLYGLLIQLLGFSSVYAVEEPGYQKISAIYRSNGVPCRYLPLDESGLSINALRNSDARIVHISPSHHFPTGITMPITRRQELLHWASNDDGRYIIEDDYDSEFRFNGIPIPPLQSIDTQGRVIYVNTFAKSLTPSIRISYMVLPRRLSEAFHARLGFYSCTVSNFEQFALAEFIEQGYFEKHISRMRNAYKLKRNLLINTLKNHELSKHVQIREENSGLHFLLEIDTTLTDDELLARAGQKGIKISSLSKYYYKHGVKDTHMLVLNYSGLSDEDIPSAVELLLSSVLP